MSVLGLFYTALRPLMNKRRRLVAVSCSITFPLPESRLLPTYRTRDEIHDDLLSYMPHLLITD